MATGRTVDSDRGVARFAAWRAGRERGERIPAALWKLAVDLASRHGMSRTAQSLGVGDYSLQEHVAARAAAPQIVDAKPALTLIDVPPPPGALAQDFRTPGKIRSCLPGAPRDAREKVRPFELPSTF